MRRLAVAVLLASGLAAADPLDDLLTTGAASAEAGRGAQTALERVDDETRALAAEYATLRRQADGLAVYNARLERQIEDQQRRLGEIATASDESTLLAREIVPLTGRMIDSLDRFIELSPPYRLDERRARISALRAGLGRTDVTVAASFRAVLDAYAAELADAERLGASTATIEWDGAARTMRLLQIGHLVLFAQSEDAAVTLMWDAAVRHWQPLADAAYRDAVADGLRMARGELPPALLRVPLPAPQAQPR